MASQRSKDIIIGAIAGTVLGAVTALLLAPKSGRELRSDIADGYQQVSEKTQQIATSVSEKTQHLAKQVGTQTTEWIGKAKEATTHAIEQVRARKSGSVDAEESSFETAAAEKNAALSAQAVETEDKVEQTIAR